MAKDNKSIQIPMKVSLLISTLVFLALWHFRQPSLLLIILRASLGIFVLFLFYFIVAQFLPKLRKSIWLPAITDAVIIYFGVLIISLSLFKNLLPQMEWDPSTAALGIAVVAFGFGLFTRGKQEQPKEISEELGARVSALNGSVEALSDKFSKLENVIDTFLGESQKLTERLTELQKEAKSKDSQTEQ